MKTEIRVTGKGRIIHVSKTHPGSVHDFAVYKQEPPLPKSTRAYVDSGYQGLDKLHIQSVFRDGLRSFLILRDGFASSGQTEVWARGSQ